VTEFKYLEATLTNENFIHEEIKTRLNSGSVYYHSFQSVSSSRFLFKTYCFYGCETWSLVLREEHGLRVFENRVLRRIFEPKREEVV
jgi:hypothetical protein